MRAQRAAIALTVTIALLCFALVSAGPSRQQDDNYTRNLALILHKYPMTPTFTSTVGPTNTNTPSPTSTLTPSITPTPSNTPTSSNTPTPSNTPTRTNTPTPTLTRTPTRTPTLTPTRDPNQCATEYPTVCIPPPPPDLNCPDIIYRNFVALPPDRHNFDSDDDQIGCEQN